jgi:hypothetical protein
METTETAHANKQFEFAESTLDAALRELANQGYTGIITLDGEVLAMADVTSRFDSSRPVLLFENTIWLPDGDGVPILCLIGYVPIFMMNGDLHRAKATALQALSGKEDR